MSESHEAIASLFKAMAHPTRVAIPCILAKGAMCVCHLAALLGKRQSYISQQLMVLRHANLVRDRREGLMVYYALSDPRLTELIEQAAEIVRAQGKMTTFPDVF